MRHRPILILAGVITLSVLSLVRCSEAKDPSPGAQPAVEAAEAWLKLVDQGKYAESWDQAGTPHAGSQQRWEQSRERGRILKQDHVRTGRAVQQEPEQRESLGDQAQRTVRHGSRTCGSGSRSAERAHPDSRVVGEVVPELRLPVSDQIHLGAALRKGARVG